MKVLRSGCPTFTTLGKGYLAQIPADTSLLLKFVPSLWRLLPGQQDGASAVAGGPAPDGQPGGDQAPVEGTFAGAVASQTCSF